jgi:hydroxypyruvate isomerase
VGPQATLRRSRDAADRTRRLSRTGLHRSMSARARPSFRDSAQTPRWSAHISTIFTDLPFLERLSAANAAGLELVEWWWSESSIDDLGVELRRLDLEVSSINGPVGDLDRGERGIAHDSRRQEQFLSEIKSAIAMASALHVPRINVLVGRDDRTRPRPQQLAQIEENLIVAAQIANKRGITLLLEGINEIDVPGYLLPSVEDAFDMVLRIDSPSVRLLYDAYHVGKAGCDPTLGLERYVGYIDHAQFAAWPDRTAPGSHHPNALVGFESALRQIGYQGAIGLEFLDPSGEELTRLVELR